MKDNFAIVMFDHVSPYMVEAVKLYTGTWNKCHRKLKQWEKEGNQQVYDYEIAVNDFEDGCNANYVQTCNMDNFWG